MSFPTQLVHIVAIGLEKLLTPKRFYDIFVIKLCIIHFMIPQMMPRMTSADIGPKFK